MLYMTVLLESVDFWPAHTGNRTQDLFFTKEVLYH
jgi:hypothetical protein